MNCDHAFPRANVPNEPTLFASGPLRVRAQSLVLDDDPESPNVLFCTPRAPLPEGARLVLYFDDYQMLATTWDGTSIANPYTRLDTDPPDEREPTVTLPGQEVTTVRHMAYCPTDPTRDCVAAGDYTRVIALPSYDPNGPRSGWDFTETVLEASRAGRATRTVRADACGLRVSLRGETDCVGATFDELASCLAGHYEEAIYGDDAPYEEDAEDGEGAETSGDVQDVPAPAPQLVFSDRTREVAIPAYGIARVACIDGVVVVSEATFIGFGSRRSFSAVDVASRRITGARTMTIVDHEEARSDCGNAWDGVELVPIVGQGALVGAVVRGAIASPRFDVGRGDVGEATFVATAPTPAQEASEDDEYYEEPPIPAAYRVTAQGLAPIEAAAPAERVACPLRVSDEDGQTNVRPDPSTRRPPVGTIATGTVIETVEQRGRWYRIERPLAGWLWSGSLSRSCTP